MTFGVYPRIGLADARLTHAKARKLLEDGIDPGQRHLEVRRTERDAESVSELIDEFVTRHVRPNRKGARDIERALRKDVEPAWGKRKARSVSRRDVILLLDAVEDRGSPVMRNRLSSLVGRMFSFAVERGILDTTPCVRIRPLKEASRDRVLTTDEVQSLWTGMDAADMRPVTRIALKLLLVTGQRRQEIVGARWGEIQEADDLLEIPAGRMKNGRVHMVPLSSLALDLLSQARELSEGSDWLFPSPISDGPLKPQTVTRALRINLAGMGLSGITPHDFRRTCATTMTKLEISQFVVGRVLSHTDQSITARVYDKNDYLPQKRQALNAWCAWLEGVISGESAADETVVPLRSG